MRSVLKSSLALAGLIAGVAMGTSAQAAVEVNMGGSSAATPFAQNVPLTVCDQTPTPPNLYVNGDMNVATHGKLFTWTCHSTSLGSDIVIRYSATGSSDGYQKLLVPETDTGSHMNFLNLATVANCTGPTASVIQIGATNYNYNLYTGCTNATPASLPIQIGWADVDGSSFHQTGPLGTTQNPIAETGLLVNKTAVVPFAFVLGNGVQTVDPASGTVAGLVQSLSQDQIISLLSRTATDWRQLGLGTAPVNPDGSPAAFGTPADATSPITLCLRKAGSGTKASLQVTVLTEGGAVETAFGSTDLTQGADGVYFGGSTQDIRDCIGGNTGNNRPAHPHAIGYMDADQAALVQNPGLGLVGKGYVVRMDGYLPNDTALDDPQAYLKCGKWKYWVQERFNTRNPSSSDSSVATLISQLYNNAIAPSTVASMNPFWVAPADMNVFKNQDAGPMTPKALPLPSNVCNSIN